MTPRLNRAFFAALGASARMGSRRTAGLRGLVALPLAHLRNATWSFLAQALSPDEKSRLGIALYDAGSEYRATPRHAWEDAWLARWLPPPPSRILVGAAGAGREVLWLMERGHEVVALEPSRELAALCRERTGVPVIERRYEDLSGPERAPHPDLEGPFAAVLLGLGSLSHLLDHGSRTALFETLDRLCPEGPLLASTLAPPQGERAERSERVGRAARVGRGLARPIRALRRLPEVEPGEVVFGGLGFAKLFARDELRALGDGLGRRTEFDGAAPDGMELCTFVRR